jgi:hypothetical protein
VKLSVPVVRFSTWAIVLVAVALFRPLAVAADVSVSAPASGAVVSSPFVLQATSATCLSQSTVSMAYSIDSGSDTVFNPATSINTSVSASQGTHTLRVKSWGSGGAFCEKDGAITVGTGVLVSSPVNGSTVPSTFLLHATAATCGGQSTSSMAYSFDSNTDNVINAQSINQNVSTSAGGHLLRVKAWGNAGAFCETDLNINVSSQSVVISTPANNSTVPTTFQLQAQAPTCNGRSTSSMTYNFAGHPDASAVAGQSIITQVTAPTTGVQQLNVKAWNGTGDLCETSVSIDAENTASEITISQPTDPNVAMSFPLQASSTSCQGIRTNSMTYSFDHLTDAPAVAAQSINTTATAPSTGAHVLHVKAWNTSGGICVQDMNINVIDGGGTGLVPGSSQNPFTRIELLGDYTGGYEPCPSGSKGGGVNGVDGQTSDSQVWQTQPDCGTVGANKTGNTSQTSPPTTPPSGDSTVRQFTIDNPDAMTGPGVRWSIKLCGKNCTDGNAYTHFQYDAWVYFDATSATSVENLELDLNQVVTTSAGKDLYIFDMECNTDNRSNPHWKVAGWKDTDTPCSIQSGWHHYQLQFHRGPNLGDSINFDKVAIDSVVQNFTCGGGPCVKTPANPTAWATTWEDYVLMPNFQIDNFASSNATAHVDQFTIYRW